MTSYFSGRKLTRLHDYAYMSRHPILGAIRLPPKIGKLFSMTKSKYCIEFSYGNIVLSKQMPIKYTDKMYMHHSMSYKRQISARMSNGQNKCRKIVSRKITLLGKIQTGRSPSRELFIVDMYNYVSF